MSSGRCTPGAPAKFRPPMFRFAKQSVGGAELPKRRPLGFSIGGTMRVREDAAGNVFIEYFVAALIVMVATIWFYTINLKNEGAGARGRVEGAFNYLAQEIVSP